MRYRFTGLRRESGQPVMGHVEAESEDCACDILGDNGLVVDGIAPDPERTDDSHLSGAIDHALEAGSRTVPLDSLRGRYQGKRVWVIDREKIKTQVLQAVDEVMRQGRGGSEDETATHDRLADALERLFGDSRNLTSPVSASQEAMEVQLNRLTDVVRELEHAVGAIRAAMRSTGRGNGDARVPAGPALKRRADPASDEVLRDIFQTNIELRRRLDDGRV